MAAKVFYRKGFLLLLFNFISTAALDKRFSDFKRCTDEECSMLLCRGKAVSDYSGPDCRFLSFKKSETIYVYYKLSGIRADFWAGSVGNHFGYFPKDLLAVNHVYTDKELEVPAEETDFVCFDTGYDKFDNYDLDSLSGSSVLMEENDSENTDRSAEGAVEETKPLTDEKEETNPLTDEKEETKPLTDEKEETKPLTDEKEETKPLTDEKEETKPLTDEKEETKPLTDEKEETKPLTDEKEETKPLTDEKEETKPLTDETTDSENENDRHDNSEGLDVATESLAKEVVESDTRAAPDTTERATEDAQKEQQTIEDFDSEKRETREIPTKPEVESLHKDDPEIESVSISEGKQIPELKTTLGTTFDAVTTDDENTWKVTPYEEEESNELEYHHDNDSDYQKEIPLLPFSEEAADTPDPDPLNNEDSPPRPQDDAQQTDEGKNGWTSLGDRVFAIVSGGKKTTHISSSEEDDEDEEEIPSEIPLSTEEAKKEDFQLLSAEPQEEPETTETDTDSEPLLFDYVDDEGGEVAGHENVQDETVTPTDEQSSHEETEDRTEAVNTISKDDRSVDPEPPALDVKVNEPSEEEDEEEGEVSEDSEIQDDNAYIQDTLKDHGEDLDTKLEENKPMTHEELSDTEIEPKEDLSIVEEKPNDSKFKDHKEKILSDYLTKRYHDRSFTDLEEKSKDSGPELSVKETEENEELPTDERYDELSNDTKMEEDNEKEELLEDENAVPFTQSHESHTDVDKPSLETSPSDSEPEYSDSVLRLTLLRDHFTEENMTRLQKYLGLSNLFRVEAMFSDLDVELRAARASHVGTAEDIEKALEGILETSEMSILDEIEKILDDRGLKMGDVLEMDASMIDDEAQMLDDFQELGFTLRQKYSVARDSTPLAIDKTSNIDQDARELDIEKEATVQHAVEEKDDDVVPGPERDDNLTVTDLEERPPEKEGERVILDDVHRRPDISVEEDGGHFNKNNDNQPSFSQPEEMQKVPQAILEKPFDVGLGVEMEQSSSGSLDSMEPVSDFHEEEMGLFSTGMLYSLCVLAMIKTKVAEWTVVVISLLPEEWKPGETLFGCPWQAVAITALVGVVSFILFFWRTVLAVKKREYLVDEKGLSEQIQALKKEKNDALSKMSQLQKQSEELKGKQKQSEQTASSALKRNRELESKVLKAETQNQQIAEEKNTYARLLEEERANSFKNETRIEKLEKSNDKLQLSRKKTQEALAKTSVLLDEAKIREDARNVQHKCLERDFSALKEENKTLKETIKGWEDKHKELNERIKVYQKSQKELEDSVVLKDHNVEVLSELLADLDACDLQKSDTQVLANGEVATDKKTSIKSRIKQMMDVSRVQTTLTVVEEERDRFMAKLLNEEKARKALEEQHRELEHSIATLKSARSHVENQYKILQQKNEIMTEMYQQKENALQQRITKEELERRSKETLLSEVGGKAVEAEEQVKVLRQRINEMDEQMKKTEEVYKEQIKEQENKTHSNWVNARNAERALNQEKVETAKLREKLAVLTSQLNERRAPLFRPNSGQHMGPRQGDSYGASPVSGGAPSPPPMIEGPRRPPSAPVGRRIDPYGPRPPSDPHGRYPDIKHGIDMMAPRTSSPANMDGSTAPVDSQTKAEASTESPEPGLGSFLTSPIRDSPSTMVQGPPPAPGPQGPPSALGPHDPLAPPGPPGRLPPAGPHRLARPGQGPHGHLYHPPAGMTGPHGPPPLNGPPLPPNEHPGMLPPGPMGGEFGPRPSNGHAFRPRPGPGHPVDPRGPPPPHFRPPPPHHFGPMPPPHGVRGPMGPRPPFPPDVRFAGPRDHPYPPAYLPPGGVPPLPPHGDGFVQALPGAPQNSVGPHPSQGHFQGQDLPLKQEAAPRDSVRPAMAEP